MKRHFLVLLLAVTMCFALAGCEKTNDGEKARNLDEGITIYQNGKIIDTNLLSRITGKYVDKNSGDYIVINEDMSKCELKIESSIYNKVVAIRLYSFTGFRHNEATASLENFVIEFCVKSHDENNNETSIANVVYVANPLADGTFGLTRLGGNSDIIFSLEQ